MFKREKADVANDTDVVSDCHFAIGYSFFEEVIKTRFFVVP